jgi:hypothetical protein
LDTLDDLISLPLSVQRWDHRDGNVVYTINVIMRDGRQWRIQKRYSEIHEFWRSMPLGSTKHLSHAFPQPSLFSLNKTEDDTFNEQRRMSLDEWFGELCMDEKSMSDSRIVALLDRFLETSAQPPPRVSFTSNSDLSSWVVIPQADISSEPLSLQSFASKLPSKVSLAELFPQRPVSKTEANVSLSITGSDVTVKQITKDLSRDRIIVQGQRYEGSECGLIGVLEATLAAAEHTIRDGGGTVSGDPSPRTPPSSLHFSREILQELCLTSLGQLGRTESAYASLSALTTVVDQGATPDLILVPESILAHPLLLRFRLVRPEGPPPSKGQSSLPHPSPLLSKESPSPLLRTPSRGAEGRQQARQHVSPLTHNISKRGSPLMAPPPPPASTADPHRRQSPRSIFDAPPPRVPASTAASHHPPPAPPSQPQQGAGPGAAIICDMQATTVYRFAHCESMQTVLQVRATFCQSIKLLAAGEEHPAARSPRSTNLTLGAEGSDGAPAGQGQQETEEMSAEEKEAQEGRARAAAEERRRKEIQRLFILSKSFVIFDRDTRTSTRDWK